MNISKTSAFAAAMLSFTASASIAATPATLTIVNAGVYQPGTVRIVGPNVNADDYATALQLGVSDGSAQIKTLYVFCVDIFHNISVGFDFNHNIVQAHGDAQAAENLQFYKTTLKVDSSGGASGVSGQNLTATQIGQIGNLTTIGQSLIKNNAPDLSNKLAGVAGAIWNVEYPTSAGYSVTGDTTAVANYMAADIAKASSLPLPSRVEAIYSVNGAVQGFAAGVPEPASWLMVIGGMAMMGSALRRRRSAVTATA